MLLGPDFDPLWRALRERLERLGLDHRTDVPLPRGLAPVVFARLGDVLQHDFPTRRRRLDLAALDRGLARHGTDLLGVLAAAGHAPVARREARLAARAQRDATAEALAQAAHERLGDDGWVAEWVAVVRPGLADPEQARRAAKTVADVLAEAAAGHRSRGEVAARVLGSAHRLDPGTPERRWVRAALAHRAKAPDRDDAALWARAGLPPDVVSAPVLTWGLPLRGDGVAAAVRALTAAGAPAPLTTLTLRGLAVDVPDGTVVLSVENPRLLEAAVEQRLPAPVVCTAGEPTTAVLLLVEGLVAAGATVHHHGDLDAGGLGITGRLVRRGAVPWRTGAADYCDALDAALVAGVALPALDPQRVPDTPWDPALAPAVRHHALAVEQERVMDALLAEHARGAGDGGRGMAAPAILGATARARGVTEAQGERGVR